MPVSLLPVMWQQASLVYGMRGLAARAWAFSARPWRLPVAAASRRPGAFCMLRCSTLPLLLSLLLWRVFGSSALMPLAA